MTNPATLDAYLDRALAAGNYRSDRQLSLALGHGGGTVCRYRGGRDWPDDVTMVRLAILADADPIEALSQLDIWRARDDNVRALRRAIAARLQRAVAPATLAFFVAGFTWNETGTVLTRIGYHCILRVFPATRRSRGCAA
jgi:hypothetical protein